MTASEVRSPHGVGRVIARGREQRKARERERVNVAIAHFPRGRGDAMANEDQHPSAGLTCRQCRLM